MPLPMVDATLRWKTKIATKLKSAAKATAWCGLRTPVETTVAMEFAASCRPFMKSKASASTTRKISTPRVISTSGVLERDAFGQVGHVEATVRDRLEQLVDRLHLDDLAHVLLFAEEPRDGRAQHAVGVRLEPVDLLARLEDDLELVVLDAEVVHHVLHALAALDADVREAHRLRRDFADVVERHRLGRVLDQVADVVHRVHQLVDVVAVERGDEGLVQQPDGLRGDAVGRMLGLVDRARVRLAVLEIVHERLERMPRAHDLLGVGVEEVEEAAFLGEQASEHGRQFISYIIPPMRPTNGISPLSRRSRGVSAHCVLRKY